ncbi:hypothetical protein TNCV_650631 [Trichonephila clavipes]|nr:hypothetical protein TNCV_650631 [Trichonephila clavipes]
MLPAVVTTEFREMLCPLYGNSFQRTEQLSIYLAKATKNNNNSTQDRCLRVLAKRDRPVTATQLTLNLNNETGASISRKTVAQRLNADGLYPRCPVLCISLTVNHKKDRLAF